MFSFLLIYMVTITTNCQITCKTQCSHSGINIKSQTIQKICFLSPTDPISLDIPGYRPSKTNYCLWGPFTWSTCWCLNHPDTWEKTKGLFWPFFLNLLCYCFPSITSIYSLFTATNSIQCCGGSHAACLSGIQKNPEQLTWNIFLNGLFGCSLNGLYHLTHYLRIG